MKDIDFGSAWWKAFHTHNFARCVKHFHAVDEWTIAMWAKATFGECGEVMNALKKISRGDGSIEAFEDELADVICYLDLLGDRASFDLADLEVGVRKGLSADVAEGEFMTSAGGLGDLVKPSRSRDPCCEAQEVASMVLSATCELAMVHHVNLETAVWRKFNAVSERVKYPARLEVPA